ncbi:hypothetical protein IW261DRAFT_1660048 [Armillaria novae-zelandiae]|uniref:Uncharacterized protein n=1 Tax=Armillaria novae-zelandiae TaxID=153914 RepID=A0AA39NWY7_9AGAR|nr:hypothetical protein IW261DRAFT_1660048 [Armillaria novae-zelandiae]
MPEIRELFFFFWVIKDFIDYSNRNSLPLDVLQLWIDGKEDEEKGIIPLPDVAVADAAEGTVFPLTKSMAHLTRGDSGSTQTPIFPSASTVPSLYHALKKGETELDICPTAGLCLQNVIKHPRMIQVLVHCSPNIYTINDWNETIRKVNKKTRKLKIVLGIQFKFHVLAFASYDNNARFYWFSSPVGALQQQSTEDDNSHNQEEDFSDHSIFEFTDPLTQFHAWLAKLVEALEAQRLCRLAKIKQERQKVIGRIISRPQPEEVELEEKEMHQKQSVTTTNASQALQDSGKLSNKKGSKKRKVDNDNNGEQPSKQKAPPQKKSKTVAPPKKKKKKEEEINRIDAYVVDFGDSKLQKRKAVTLPAPPPVPKHPKISPEPSKSLNAASSAYIHAIEPIFTFIKRSDSPFEGVGVYSCAIILHNSEEVLNCPARLARLIESYFNFISFMKSKKDADYILRHSRKRHRLTINATEKEKLEYHGSLSVYGKEKCYVSQRHAHLIKLFNSVHESASTPFSSSGVDFYDPFEPAYIENTLSLPGHLGHLIFGIETWKKMCPSSGIEEEIGKDPLSQYFDVLAKKNVKLLESKYLDLKCYRDTLQVSTKKCYVMPYVYKYNSSHKQLWSVLDLAAMPKYKNKAYEARLLSTIKTTTDGWTVGPLDFCAVALCIHVHGKEQLAICRGDPQRLTPHDIQFVKHGFETRKTSQCRGHKAQVPLTIQSSWLEATEATHLIDQAWYNRREEIHRIELAEVDKEQAWQFNEEEKYRATTGNFKRQHRVKGVQLKK